MFNSKYLMELNELPFLILFILLVINTVSPGKIEKLVKDAEESRKKDYEKDNEGEFIEIDAQLYKLLKLTPIFNSKILLIILNINFNIIEKKGKMHMMIKKKIEKRKKPVRKNVKDKIKI